MHIDNFLKNKDERYIIVHLPTIILVEVIESLVQVFFLFKFMPMHGSSNKFSVINGPTLVNISLKNVKQV